MPIASISPNIVAEAEGVLNLYGTLNMTHNVMLGRQLSSFSGGSDNPMQRLAPLITSLGMSISIRSTTGGVSVNKSPQGDLKYSFSKEPNVPVILFRATSFRIKEGNLHIEHESCMDKNEFICGMDSITELKFFFPIQMNNKNRLEVKIPEATTVFVTPSTGENCVGIWDVEARGRCWPVFEHLCGVNEFGHHWDAKPVKENDKLIRQFMRGLDVKFPFFPALNVARMPYSPANMLLLGELNKRDYLRYDVYEADQVKLVHVNLDKSRVSGDVTWEHTY